MLTKQIKSINENKLPKQKSVSIYQQALQLISCLSAIKYPMEQIDSEISAQTHRAIINNLLSLQA